MKKRILLLAFLGSFYGALAQTYVQVKDINPGSGNGLSNLGVNTARIGNTIYFAANDNAAGWELWKSDGTPQGTVMVKDINPSGNAFNQSSTQIININNTLYFQANDGVNGAELWKSDGTAAGTVLVRNINTNTDASANGSFPYQFVELNGTLYFIAAATGAEQIWKTDGTAVGTVQVSAASVLSPNNLTAGNNAIYFTADNGTNGTELWKSDGTMGGTAMVKDIMQGAGNSNPSGITNVNGTIFFAADDGTNNIELWKSDGTADGTLLVKNINPSTNSFDPISGVNLFNVNGVLFFTANDGTNGAELWKSDGTIDGTSLIKDIRPGSNGSNPFGFVLSNNILYFIAVDGTNGRELWKSDGTINGTTLVKDVSTGHSFPATDYNLISQNGSLYFIDLANSLWQSDGTNTGTIQLVDGSSSGISSPMALMLVDTKFLFAASSAAGGNELWSAQYSTLPVSLLSFNGKSTLQGNFLQWNVANEVDFTGYELQRATADKLFRKIALLPAQGRSTYQFTDNNPIAGANYYRLKMIDADGSFKMSENVVALNFDLNKSNEFAVWPVPVKDKLNLRNAKGTLHILSTNGQLVQKTIIKSNEISSVNVAQLPVGAYILQLQLADGQMLTKKLIKQ
jgi:ELWxxDGT repeat protein